MGYRRYAGLVVIAYCALVAHGSAAAACDDQGNDAGLFDLSDCEIDGTTLELAAPPQHDATTSQQQASGDSLPWIAGNGAAVPLTLTSSDTGVSAKASLDAIRDYNSRLATVNVVPDGGLASTAPATLTLPKAPVARQIPLDIWGNVDVQGYSQQQSGFAAAAVDETARTSAGIDYKIGDTAKIGLSAERGDIRSAAQESLLQQEDKVSAYVTWQAAPSLSLDARREWQGGNEAFATATGISEKNSVIVAPRLDHSFALNDGETLKPFVAYKTVFDIGGKSIGEPAGEPAVTRSAEAGVTFSKADSYSLSVSTSVDGLSAVPGAETVNGKFEFKLPIK
jgi:hypothetical protein